MMKMTTLLACLLLVGCGQSKDEPVGGVAQGPKKTILQRLGLGGPSKEEIAAQQEFQTQQLKDGDALVAKWADKVQETATKDGFGFTKMEGLTEADPWGQQIKVYYRQEWFNEIATIQSAGPDGVYGNDDDLIRIRSAKNPAGVLQGISTIGWIVLAWLFCSLTAWAFSSGVGGRRVKKGKSNRYRHPVAHAMSTTVFSPITMPIYALQYIGGILGANGEFFDGFDSNFIDLSSIPLDLDIDL